MVRDVFLLVLIFIIVDCIEDKYQQSLPQIFMAVYIVINMTNCNKNIMKASQGLQYSFKRRFYHYTSK